MKTRLLMLLAFFLLLVGACSSTEQAAPIPQAPLEVDKQPSGTIEAVDNPDIVMTTRWARRMQIDRLQASVPKVAGADIHGDPIRWLINGQDGFSDAVFGEVLGRPNYVTSTEENPSPSSLYLKFIRDMARDVCTQIVDNDLLRESNHTLWRFAPIDGSASDAQLTENLRYLVHRWLGLRLAADEPLISDLRAVFDAGTESLSIDPKNIAAQAEGWRGVCIALFESPTFHLD